MTLIHQDDDAVSVYVIGRPIVWKLACAGACLQSF